MSTRRPAESPLPAPASPAPTPGPVSDPESVVLEALRLAYEGTGAGQYLAVYEQLRARVEQRRGPDPQPGPGARAAAPPAVRSPAPAHAGTGAHAAAKEAAPTPIRVVCATREDRDGFFSSTALGRSLSLHRPEAVQVRLFPRNAQGLSSVYNTAIAESARTPTILLFVHDDVHLCDFHWADSLRAALEKFDIVGLAGNRRRVPRQPGWGHIDERFRRDERDNLSGTVAHGTGFPAQTVDVFGPSGQRVALLDGLFLAARSETLQAKSLRFDERFDFHFYDLDLCRQADRAGLTLGTWPISVVHESKGGYTSDGWQRGYEAYLEKWGD